MRADRDPGRREIIALLAALSAGGWARAQGAYPSRPLKIVVPQPPGGGWDTVARMLAEPLGRAIGQPVTVENRTGAGTVVGTEYAAKAPPDGHTLLLGGVPSMAFNLGMYKTLGYDSLRDFEPVGLAVNYPHTLVIRKSLGFTSLRELVDHARANPRKLSYASAGAGSGQHVLAAALWQGAGVELLHVPYRGSQPAYQDLIGERVDMIFDSTPTTRPHVEAGYLRPLVSSGSTRNPAQPDVPTLGETGVSNLVYEGWIGLFVSSKTPVPILDKLRQELARVITSTETSDAFRKVGGKPLALSVEQTRKIVRDDVAKWSQIVRDLGITPA